MISHVSWLRLARLMFSGACPDGFTGPAELRADAAFPNIAYLQTLPHRSLVSAIGGLRTCSQHNVGFDMGIESCLTLHLGQDSATPVPRLF